VTVLVEKVFWLELMVITSPAETLPAIGGITSVIPLVIVTLVSSKALPSYQVTFVPAALYNVAVTPAGVPLWV